MKQKKWSRSLVWTLGGVGNGVAYLLTAQLTYAMTESFGISAVAAGMVFLVSRIFDGVTDIIAGMIIDRTHSKLGKGRVWDLCSIPMWIFVVMSFSVPSGWSQMAKVVFVFLAYNMYASVFNTLLSCADTIRLKNTFDEEGRIHAISVSGVLASLLAGVVGVVMPIMIPIYASRPHGWTFMVSIFAVPCCIFSLIKFFFLKEINQAEHLAAKEEKIGIVESVKLLVNSKYVMIIFLITLMRGVVGTITGSASTYYFAYVFGDVAAAAVPGMASLFLFIGAAFIPVLVRKFGNSRTIMYGLIVTAAGYLLRYVMPTNLAWYTICTAIAGLTSLPITYLTPVMLIDAMEHNRLKNGRTPEGVFSAARSLADKLGLGLGAALTGIFLQFGALPGGGYSRASICFLNNGLSALIQLLIVVTLIFYNLDKKMPKIRQELAERDKKESE